MDVTHSGYLTKEGGSIKTWRKRWCVLKNGEVRYFTKKGGKEQGIIRLDNATGIDAIVYKRKKFIFKLPTPDRIYYLSAKSKADRDEWIKRCRLAKEALKAPPEVLSKPAEDGSATPTTVTTKRIAIEDFELRTVIGKGSFGRVLLVTKKTGADAGTSYAMKVLNKATVVERHEVEHTKTEKRILKLLKHPFLVNLHYSFQTRDSIYFIMDYVNGGELFFHLQKDKKFSEVRARFYCAEIVCGLAYLHEKGILYRDLKPENLLISASGHICMTDFGISKEGLVAKDSKTATFCGTPEYLAPEVLESVKYGKEVDWWSFGTLMFEMLTGLPPFYAEDVQEMYQKIIKADLKLPPSLGAEAGDLLSQLLTRDPAKRLAEPEKIKAHPWFASIDFDALVRLEVVPPYVPEVKSVDSIEMISTDFTSEKLEDDSAGKKTITAEEDEAFNGFTFVPGDEEEEEAESLAAAKAVDVDAAVAVPKVAAASDTDGEPAKVDDEITLL